MDTLSLEQHKHHNFKSVSYLTEITKMWKGGEPRPTSTVTGRLPHNRTATTKWCSMQYALGWRMTRVQTDLGAIEDSSKFGVTEDSPGPWTADCIAV